MVIFFYLSLNLTLYMKQEVRMWVWGSKTDWKKNVDKKQGYYRWNQVWREKINTDSNRNFIVIWFLTLIPRSGKSRQANKKLEMVLLNERTNKVFIEKKRALMPRPRNAWLQCLIPFHFLKIFGYILVFYVNELWKISFVEVT